MQDTSELKFEIFIDDDRAEKVVHGRVPWPRAPWLDILLMEWQCPGLEPTLFKDGDAVLMVATRARARRTVLVVATRAHVMVE